MKNFLVKSAAPATALGSSNPGQLDPSTRDDRRGHEGRGSLSVTTELPPLGTGIYLYDDLLDVFKYSGASAAGYSAVSEFLGCPEKSRLRSMGVIRKVPMYAAPTPMAVGSQPVYELDDLEFGTLVHYLRSVRLDQGEETMFALLDAYKPFLFFKQYMKILGLFRAYAERWPNDGFEILGIEVQVNTDLRTRDGRECLRTVRYDTVIRAGGLIYSFEAKTSAKSGASAMNPYKPQGMCQTAIWNSNPHLVAKYGPMSGVIFDVYIKTETPNVERYGPFDFGERAIVIAREYLRLPEDGAIYRANADGSFPRMLHACWGRWRPCDYMNLCHEGTMGDYQFKNGEPYRGE